MRSLNHLLCIHYEKSRNGDDIRRTAWGAAQDPGISGYPCPDERVYDAVPTAEEQSPARIIQPRFHDERDDANDCDENYINAAATWRGLFDRNTAQIKNIARSRRRCGPLAHNDFFKTFDASFMLDHRP